MLEVFQSFPEKTVPEMTYLGCAVRPSVGGLSQQAIVILGQRLTDSGPEAPTQKREDSYFSRCLHCKHPPVVRVGHKQHSQGIEYPNCRRTYAVVASNRRGRFLYVNEFLNGYSPSAVFAKDISRLFEFLTICSAVHGNCVYTHDPSDKADDTDAWQTSLETQGLDQGYCEDSAIYRCDWLLAHGFQARVALGRYGDLGGHAWVMAKLNDREYLLESTEAPPDLNNPPLVSNVGSRYIPEVLFDRFAIYVRSTLGQAWKNDYWTHKVWTRVEPRVLNPGSEPLPPEIMDEETGTYTANPRVARSLLPRRF
jgi:hypothetical protein